MHRIEIAMRGEEEIVRTLEVEDGEAFPLFLTLKRTLFPDGAEPAKKTRRGRKAKEAVPEETGASFSATQVESADPSAPEVEEEFR